MLVLPPEAQSLAAPLLSNASSIMPMTRAETDAAGLWTRDIPEHTVPKPARDGCRWDTCSAWRSTKLLATKELSPRIRRAGSAYKRALAEEKRQQAAEQAAQAARAAAMLAEARAQATAEASERAAAELTVRALEQAVEELRIDARALKLRNGPGELARGGGGAVPLLGAAYQRLAWSLALAADAGSGGGSSPVVQLLPPAIVRRVALLVPFAARSLGGLRLQRYALAVESLHERAVAHVQPVQENVGAPLDSKAPGIQESDLRDLMSIGKPPRSLETLAQAVCITLDIDPPSKRREVDPELELVAPEPDWWRGLMMAASYGRQFIEQVRVRSCMVVPYGSIVNCHAAASLGTFDSL